MPKTFPFAPQLRRPPLSVREIEKRLERFLRDLRARNLPEDESPAWRGHITRADSDRINRRAAHLHAAQRKAQAQLTLKQEDWEQLEAVFAGITLQGPATAHRADEIAAALFDDMPWMRDPITLIWRDMRQAAQSGDGLRFRPLLLDGPPSVGKTHLARRLAALAGVPGVLIDIGAASDGFQLAGSTRNWGKSTPGRVVETILARRIANPVVFVDELEKGSAMVSTSGLSTSATHALLGMMEPASARDWECPYFRVGFNLSRVNWILACNDTRSLPPPLLSRCRVLHLREPTRDELSAFASRQIAQRGLDPAALDVVATLLNAMPTGHNDLCLRGILRIIDDLQALEEMPVVC